MPYPNEHAARLRDPGDFAPGTFRRRMGSGNATVFGAKVPNSIAVIYGKLKDATAPADPVIPQALRFPTRSWTEAEARAWLKENKIVSGFEAAAEAPKGGAKLSVPASALRFAGAEAVELEAAAPAAEGAKIEPRRFKMLANSGRPFRWMFGSAVVDLETLEAPSRIPVLVNHDRDQIAGYAETAEVSGRGYEVAGRLSDATEAGRKVAELSDEGFPWQSSFGMIPGEVREVPAGVKVRVNGEEHDGPCSVLSGCRLTECSFVPAGADGDTSAEALGAPATVALNVVREEVPMPNDPTPIPVPAPATAAPTPDPVALERERARGIVAEAMALGLADRADALVADGVTLAEARVKLRDVKLAALKAAAPAPVGSEATPAQIHASLPAAERAKMEFGSNPAVREEFPNAETYDAWLRAEARDAVRLYRRADEIATAGKR